MRSPNGRPFHSYFKGEQSASVGVLPATTRRAGTGKSGLKSEVSDMTLKVCVLITVLVLTATGLRAQGDRGIITGTVKDSTGAVVPGVEVTAIHLATNTSYKASTTASGDFTVPALPVGNYQVRVEHTGFKIAITNDIVVAAGATVRLDVALELGTTQQTIEVATNAQILQADTARVSTEVSSKLVDELPLLVNGAVRSPFDLATITPEVAGNGDSNLRIGGGRIGGFGMTLDGTAITVARPDAQVSWSQINSPSVEALTEFSVEAGGFKAETGHASGGTVSFVSKSGTNSFHGDAYEFLRNQDLDARGFFAATKAVYKQNDFGATVGGPVWLPKIYNGRNKTFFFFSYEGFRNRVGASATPYTVPPPEFFTGDLHNWVNASGKMIPIYDPASTQLVNGTYVRTPFLNNQIPQSEFDPVAKAIMGYVQPLARAEPSGSGPRHLGVRPQQRRFLRHFAVSEQQVQHQGRSDDDVEAENRVPFQPHAGTGSGGRQLHSHAALSAVGQSGLQPRGRLSPELRLHALPDLAEPRLRGRQQLAAEPRIVYHR